MYRIGNRAGLLLENSFYTPSIHSVFQNAINIVCEDDYLIAILPEPMGCGPLAVTLSTWCFSALKEKIGTEGAIFITNVLSDFGRGRIEDYRLPEKLNGLGEAEVRRNMDKCRQLLADSGKPYVAAAAMLGMETLYSPRFEAAMEALKGCIGKNDSAVLAAEAYKIIGLGPGLTPSGDDFLYGMFAALLYGSRYMDKAIDWISSALKMLIPRCRFKTTAISYNMLRSAEEAEFNEYMTGSLKCLFCGSEEDLEDTFGRLLDIGSSSGSDMAAGVLFGLEALTV